MVGMNVLVAVWEVLKNNLSWLSPVSVFCNNYLRLFFPVTWKISKVIMANLAAVISKFYNEYSNRTPKKLKIIDAYLLYILLTGIVQFIYCLLVGTFPFNSFLSGFISSVSCFVLAGKIPAWQRLSSIKYYIQFFQFVWGYKWTLKTRTNSKGSVQNVDMQILYSHM